MKSLVKHISYLSEANEISSTPIPYIKFQNEEFTNLLDPESEVLKMLQGEFSYISKSNLLTLKFKKAVNQCESQILMILCEEGPKSYLHFVIRRDHLLQDTITQLKMIQPSELMKQIHVTFVGEEGRDQGGVSKEFFSLISKEIFSTKHFEKYQNFIFFNSNADNISHNHDLDNICQFYEYYELCGKLIGIAIHNSIIIPVRFPQLLYKMLRKSMIRLGDLEEIKPEVIQSLKSILCLKERADFNALSLFFDVTIFDEKENIVKTVPLIKNGSQIQVNENNVDMYVIEMKRFILKAYNNVFNHFKKGFWDAIGSKTLRMFTDEELDIIISGQWEYDWKGFRDSTCYTSGYTKKSETIQMFWEVFENDLDENQKKEFLLFVTGSKISPVEGLSGLGFIISRSGDINLLPVSHTCFNVFQLPDYKDINLIRKNLQICINNNEGFGFI
ncbi:hypothetical protein TRFO_28906 [Tritrichomonas foetus]|uniref:HECT-type E3 ubiquitin transferase n=1 Tax=Tritrichomonas foetus TaxID=1144522 RepID=A0A1J4JWX3_9EUKA|nr:hypothetical protein TRFO_28906 [Tritrichomonas foetus]|eukprot:OHT03647.1 hypothetical protein TRFO_28906 [Tritrichomonas foetus]